MEISSLFHFIYHTFMQVFQYRYKRVLVRSKLI